MGAWFSKKPRNDRVAAQLAADEDPVAQAFVQRRASLTQEQWETFLHVKDPSSRGGSAYGEFASSKFSGKAASGPAPAVRYHGMLRRKPTAWDLEQAEKTLSQGRRRTNSIFGLPLISPLTRPYKLWTSWILLLDLIYTAFLVPILVGFQVPDIGWGWGCIINLVAGAFYFVELCLGFHVGFVGKHNMSKKLIMDGKAVAWFYVVRGQFIVDMITAIAWVAQIILIGITISGTDLSGSTVTTVYQIIRILRMIRFVSLMNRLYATAIAAGGAIFPALNVKPQYAYFVNLIYGGLAILSFLSCLMNFVAEKEGFQNTWVNYFPVWIRDYGSSASQSAALLTSDDAGAIPADVRWLGGAYFMLVTMLSIGYGDITPRTEAEILVCMFCMIAGIIFFGILLGSIAEALTDLNKESKRIARYRARMEAVDKWMSKRSLPKGLRQRIGHYYQEEWIRDAEAVEEVQIMEELPHQLRRDISFSINRKVFKQLNLFHDFPAREQALIAASMTPIQLPAGADICEADDVADCIYILHEGSVAEVGPSGQENQVYEAPALLGESALLRELDDQYYFRPCALRTRQMCLLWAIPMRDLLPLLRLHPALYHRAVQQAVPSMSFDYLKIVGTSDAMGGAGPMGQGGEYLRTGTAAPGSPAEKPSSLVSFRAGSHGGVPTPPPLPSPFAGKRTDASPDTHRSEASSTNGASPNKGLHSVRSMPVQGSGRPNSWTAVQQQHLRSARSTRAGQSQGFNGLINKGKQ